MPIFEYRCTECAHLEEVLQKHSDPAPDVCPACGKKNTMHKEMSLTSFQLKGGGWYKDLYSSSSSSTASSSSSPAKTESAPAKTESAPAKPSTNDKGGSSGGSSSGGSSSGGSSSGGGGASASSTSSAAA